MVLIVNGLNDTKSGGGLPMTGQTRREKKQVILLGSSGSDAYSMVQDMVAASKGPTIDDYETHQFNKNLSNDGLFQTAVQSYIDEFKDKRSKPPTAGGDVFAESLNTNT
jgi:hypothetical protein